MAFITSRNSPNVRKVTGSVMNTNKGFTVAFRRPKTMAIPMVVIKLSI